MKYIYFIIIIFFLSSCTSKTEQVSLIHDYIPNNSIRLIRTEKDTSLLINKDEIYYMLILNRDNIDDIEVDYLIKYKDIDAEIDSEEEYILEENITIDNIEFKINNKIEIIFNNHNYCIYIKELNEDDFSNCNFIYLYNPNNKFYITLNSDLLGLIYHSYAKFNYRFLNHLATVWIETYTLDKDSYMTISIQDNDVKVTSNKIKNKTIHKR